MNPNNLLARLREWWQAQDTKRKVVFALSVTAIVLTAVFLLQILLRPTFAPLFSRLDPAEAGSIVEELESMNVPYRLTNGGKTIEVPQSQVYRTRIQLASSGVLVGGGKGFELFDEQSFGITDFQQQVGYQRALQEELRRTIVQLNEVEQARVHLVLPRESIFEESEGKPSAAIALKLEAASKLRPPQVQGIVDIVTGAVQGLNPQDVHIVDMKGNVLNDSLLSPGGGETFTVQSTTRYELRRNFERQMENRIQEMLSRILGPGSAVAMVTAELNFDQRESTSTTHGPGQIISQKDTAEEGTGAATGGSDGGPAGTDGQFGTFPGLAETNNGNSYNREENLTNYELDTYRETIVSSPGKVERLSVAVVIDRRALGDVENQQDYTNKLNQIQNLVASAAGYDAARGDQITVSGMPFDTSLENAFQQKNTTPVKKTAFPEIDPLMAGSAAGGLFLLLLLFLFSRRRKKRRKAMEMQGIAAQQPPAPPPEPEPIIPREPDKRDRVRELAREKPDDVAEVLKLWLKE